MNNKNTYKELLIKELSEFNPENIRFDSFYDNSRLMFDVKIEGEMKTCVILVDLGMTKYMIKKEIKKYFIPNFIEVYKWLIGDVEDNCDDYDDYDPYSYEDDEDEDEDYESIDSVAEGCGFYIDDDGHWIPLENDYISWDIDDNSPLQIECRITLADGTEMDAEEYSHFILY